MTSFTAGTPPNLRHVGHQLYLVPLFFRRPRKKQVSPGSLSFWTLPPPRQPSPPVPTSPAVFSFSATAFEQSRVIFASSKTLLFPSKRSRSFYPRPFLTASCLPHVFVDVLCFVFFVVLGYTNPSGDPPGSSLDGEQLVTFFTGPRSGSCSGVGEGEWSAADFKFPIVHQWKESGDPPSFLLPPRKGCLYPPPFRRCSVNGSSFDGSPKTSPNLGRSGPFFLWSSFGRFFSPSLIKEKGSQTSRTGPVFPRWIRLRRLDSCDTGSVPG